MPHLSVNQQTTSVNTDCPLPIADTYANAILRTLSSFKLPSPPISIHASRQHRHSYSHSKTVSQSVINEVSGLKTCIYRCSYICSSFSHSYFQVEVNGRSTSFFSTCWGLLVMSYIQDVMIFRLSLKLNISVWVHVLYFCLVCGDDKLILFRHCKELKDYHCPEIQITYYIYIYIYIYVCIWHKLSNEELQI